MAHILSDNCFEYSKRRLVRACQLLNIYVACARQECVNRFWIRFGLVPDFALLPCVWKPLPNELKLLVLWFFSGEDYVVPIVVQDLFGGLGFKLFARWRTFSAAIVLNIRKGGWREHVSC